MTYRLPLEWLQPVKMSRIIEASDNEEQQGARNR
jgi:hypothetical protein